MNYIEIYDHAGLRRIPAGGSYTLGRAPYNDVILYGTKVSRNHARLVLRGDRVILEDIGSTHGTSVNGRPLFGPSLLRDGDQIRMGDVWLIYCYLSSATTDRALTSAYHLPANPSGSGRPAQSRLAENMVRCIYCGVINLKNNTSCYGCGNMLRDSLDTPLHPSAGPQETGERRSKALSHLKRKQAAKISRWPVALLAVTIVVVFCLMGLLVGILLAETKLSQGWATFALSVM